jgi:hypothetical protein
VNGDGRRGLEVFNVLGLGIGATVLPVLSGGVFRFAEGGAGTLRTAIETVKHLRFFRLLCLFARLAGYVMLH